MNLPSIRESRNGSFTRPWPGSTGPCTRVEFPLPRPRIVWKWVKAIHLQIHLTLPYYVFNNSSLYCETCEKLQHPTCLWSVFLETLCPSTISNFSPPVHPIWNKSPKPLSSPNCTNSTLQACFFMLCYLAMFKDYHHTPSKPYNTADFHNFHDCHVLMHSFQIPPHICFSIHQ